MYFEHDMDGIPQSFKKIYSYFSDDDRMKRIVRRLIVVEIKDRERREIEKMIERKAGKGAIRKKVLETNDRYQPKALNQEEIKEFLEFIKANEDQKNPKIKKSEEKESINSRQKSFRARKALENTKRVSFYLSEEKKARMDAMRIKRGITQEELLNEMIDKFLEG